MIEKQIHTPPKPGDALFGSLMRDAMTGLADCALGRVSADDIGQALALFSEKTRRSILRQVGLRDMRRPNAIAAKAVLMRMHRGDPRSRTALRDCFSLPLVTVFQNKDRLSTGDCVLLLQPDGARASLGRAPHLLSALRFAASLPESIVSWALARSIEEGVALAPIALGVLQASADDLGVNMAAALRNAWADLRSREPSLPEIPLSLTRLLTVAMESEDGPREDTGMADASADELSGRLQAVRDFYAVAAEAARRLLAAFEAGHRPRTEDLETVNGAVARFDELRKVLGGESLAELGDAVSALTAHAIHEERVRSLTRVQGPSAVEEVLAEVREAATNGSPLELHLLVDLIELAPDPEADVYELVEEVRAKLPATWSRVITAASRNQLELRPPAPASAIGTSDGEAAAPVSEAEVQSEADGGAESDAGAEAEAEGDGHAGPDSASSDPDLGFDDLDELLVSERTRTDFVVPKSRPALPVESIGSKAVANGATEDSAPATATGDGSTTRSVAADASEHRMDGEPGLPADAVAAEAAALRQGRFGLASWIRKACERPGAEVRARQAAALAHELSDYGGLVSAAFTEAVSAITRDGLLQDDAGQLLVWSAAIRAGIIQPTPESARLLREFAPIVAAHPGLTALGEAFARASVSTIFLVPSVSDQLRGTVQVEERQVGAVAAAAKLLEEGPRRKIRLQRATDIWRKLLQEDSPVGRLLAIAANDGVDGLEEAEKLLNKLRASGVVDRLIDGTAAKVKAGPSRSKIIAGARKTLTEYVGEAIDCGAEWVTAVHKVQSARRRDGGDRGRDSRLTDLLRETAAVREQTISELDELATGPLLVPAAAAKGAYLLISQTLRLLEGEPLSKEPASPGQVLGRDLLPAAEIRLTPEGLEPIGEPTLEQLIPVAQCVPDWEAAFEARAERDDHDGTQALLAVVQRIDPQLTARLRKRRDELVASAEERRAERIEKTRDLLAQLRRDGVLEENEATRLEASLEAMRTAEREDFGWLAEELDTLDGEISDLTERSKALVRDDLAKTGAKPTVIDRISAYIDRADLTTAREFIAQTTAGREIPSVTEGKGHFSRFYPGFPQTFGALGVKRGHTEGITQLIEALPTGAEVADPRFRSLLAEVGVDLGAVRRPEIGRDALRQWRQLAQSQRYSGQLPTVVAQVLRALGAEGRQIEGGTAPEKHRTWITLDRVRTGHALLPAFGSHKSPSGDTLRLLLVWNRPGPKEIIGLLKDEPADHTVLVWYFGVLSPADRRQLVAESRRRPRPTVAVLDDAAIGYLACLPEPDWSAMAGILAPFTAVNPFAPTGDVPEEMFYGRADQLDAVTGRQGGSFVYGGRQLGKSALLRAAERRLRKSDPDRVVVRESVYHVGRDAPLESVWASLHRPLTDAGVISPTLSDPSRDEICHAIRDWAAADQQRQLLILLDETDEFLNKDAESTRFAHVKAFWELMDSTGHRVKIVFAGLHQTARFRSLPNQPLAHFGAPVSIGPLAPQDAFDLLTKPLGALGFELPDTLGARIIAEANNAPALIQLFADALLTRLRQAPVGERTLPYEITREDLDRVWADPKLAQDFRDRFEWTIDLDKRYKVIAYAVALHALSEGADSALTAGRLEAECQGWWPQGFDNLSSDAFRGLLEECAELGILARDRELFRLRTPHILTLLGGAGEVEEVLDKADSFELPDSFDAQSYRTVYQNGPDRSPLTCGQVSQLLEGRAQVYVVAGSDALHLERVARALQAETDRHRDVMCTTAQWSNGTFDGIIETARRHSGQTIGLVNLARKTHLQAIEQIQAAGVAVRRNGLGGRLTIVCLAPPELAPLWLAVRNPGTNPVIDLGDETRLIELRRFSAASVRQWMHAETLPFQDADDQQMLLTITGGWPSLISSVFGVAGVNDRTAALARCETQLRDRPDELVRAAGILTSPPLATAWRTLVDYGSPDVPAELAELLTMTDSPDLTAGMLSAHGYQGTSDVIEVIKVLGALVPVTGDEHRLHCEPVLAQATRAMGEAQ